MSSALHVIRMVVYVNNSGMAYPKDKKMEKPRKTLPTTGLPCFFLRPKRFVATKKRTTATTNHSAAKAISTLDCSSEKAVLLHDMLELL